MDANHHLWLLHYDRGKYNPSELLDLIELHARRYPETTVWVEEVAYQRSLRHFAYKRMDETGFRYKIEALPPDNRRNAKDYRIRNIVNQASTFALHIKPAHTEFKREFCDYPSGLTVDILDITAWALKILRPRPKAIPRVQDSPFTLDNIIKGLKEQSGERAYPFNVQLGRKRAE